MSLHHAKNRFPSWCLVAVCIAVLDCSSAIAQPDVYEPWDLGISDGASVVGLGGASSTGFDSSSWDFTLGAGSATYDSIGLAYTDGDGNELLQSAGAVSIAASEVNTRWGRSLADPLSSRPDEYYLSYLLRLDSADAGDAFWSSDGAWDKGAVGLQGSPALKFINGPTAGVDALQGESNLLVVRINRDATTGEQDFAELWVNPILTSPGSPDATFTTGGNANNRVRDASLALFKFNAVNSGAYTIDELRIGETFSDVTPFVGIPTLAAKIDTSIGDIRLVNESGTTLEIASYEITSSGGTLSSQGFLSLETQDRPDFPTGDGSGNGWEVVGTPDAEFMAEQFLTGTSTFGPGGQLTLGAAYDTLVDARDVQIKLLLQDDSIFTITDISYLETTSTLPGDYNNDQIVNIADYTVWRDALGSTVPSAGDGADGNADGVVNSADYAIWKIYFGNALSGSASLDSSSVPEPAGSMIASLVLFFACVLVGYRKNALVA